MWKVCVYVAKRGEGGMQYWYSIKTDARCFVCQVLARLFALKAIQRGSEQMAGRSCLCYFWTFPLKVSDCCPFSPLPPLMYVFLSSFLSPFLLENFFLFLKHISLIIQHHLKAGCVSDERSCRYFISVCLGLEKVAGGTLSSWSGTRGIKRASWIGMGSQTAILVGSAQ